MTDWNIGTGAEQPINRVGVDNIQETGEVQGMLVGIDTSASPPEVVRADADDTVAIPVVGAVLPEEVMDVSAETGGPLAGVEEQLIRENRTLLGDRVTTIQYGVLLVNDDADTDFTPGEPVYLAVGGGLTQTKPDGTTGNIIQSLGVALPETDDGETRVLLDVEHDYTTA